jgi:gliding motility-associated-like protein
VNYTSAQPTGTLQIKPAADKHGTATLTVRVEDSGPNAPSPNINFITRSFNLIIQPVNDLPVFTSTPVTLAEVGALYEYTAEAFDVEGNNLTFTVPSKPGWLTFTPLGGGRVRLHGTPPDGPGGNASVRVRVSDGVGSPVDQDFVIFVNSRPVVFPFSTSTNEDQPLVFSAPQFAGSFSDSDGNSLVEIRLDTLPNMGILTLNNVPVVAGQIIAVNALGALQYTPLLNYSGQDSLYWSGSDGTYFSFSSTYAAIKITPVNDVPAITTLEADTLKYEIGRGTRTQLTQRFEAVDVDDEFLTSAEIGFRRQNFRSASDRLEFTATTDITGTYDTQAGILTLIGTATVAAYVEAIRSITYSYSNFSDLVLDTRSVYFTLNDGKGLSETRDRLITLTYTFEPLDIPEVFTPNGDGANDTWKISSTIGLEQYNDAVIRIYDKRGQMRHEMKGFEVPWDGTSNHDPLPADVYYYTIDLRYNNIRYQGTVTLLK